MREVDKLEDDSRYEATVDILGFCNKGHIDCGKSIKDNIPFDLSERDGWKTFFKKISV